MERKLTFDEQVQTPPRATSWFIFLVLVVSYTYFLPRWADWNVNSRMDLILAVADRHTFQIDEYYQNTGDYAKYNEHYYSDKAPGSSLIGIPVYAVFKLLGGRGIIERIAPKLENSAFVSTLYASGRGMVVENLYFFAALTFVTFFTSVVPSALLAVLLYQFALERAKSAKIALIVALAYGLATPAFAYANNLYGHQLSAFLLFAAFFLAYHAARGVHSLLYSAIVGLLLGSALITEYPTALIVGAIGLYAIYKWRNVKMIALTCAAGAPPLLLMMAYNYAIFSTPLPVGYLYSPLYSEVHHIGLISLTYPKLDIIFQLAVGTNRGLFLISPYLVLSIPGFILFARDRAWRAEFFVTSWAAISFWLFNSASAMWEGGFAVGPRYLLPMLPFLAFPLVYVLNRARATWARVAIGSLLALSALIVWLMAIGGQQFPHYEDFPLIQYSLPQLWNGALARNIGMVLNLNGFSSLVPLMLLLVLLTLAYVWRERPLRLLMRLGARDAQPALNESH